MKITVYNNDVSKAYRILQKKLNNEGTLRELNPPLIKPIKPGKILKNNVLCKYQRRYLHESI